MADVFKRFITNVTTTDLTTVFTVPTANVAASPPVPVSTFIVKTINVHNYDGSASVTVNIDHNNGSSDLQIFEVAQKRIVLIIIAKKIIIFGTPIILFSVDYNYS